MKRHILTGLLLFCCVWLLAQPTDPGFSVIPAAGVDESPIPFGESINSTDLKEHLSVLASDELEGRETGTVGNEKAAQYLADQFKRMGLDPVSQSAQNPSYFQPVMFSWTMWNDISLKIKNENYRHLRDFVSFPTRNGHQPVLDTREVIFLGYGIDDPRYSDYKGAEVKDKTILIYKGEPTNEAGISHLTGSASPSEWSTDWKKKLAAARKHGVKTVLIIENELKNIVGENRRFLVGPHLTMGMTEQPEALYANNLSISTTIAQEIMGKRYKKVIRARDRIKKYGKPKKVKLRTNLTLVQDKNLRQLTGNNVLGYIEGTDEELKEEVVVITAHYDHLGKRGDAVYYGADDNGSGTSTVLEIAEAFAKARAQGAGPRRSVLTMLVTGEEKGLLGSKYYAENPLFPLEQTVANVNVDMVGRVDARHKDNPNYIYVIGSDRLSTELHRINEQANDNYTGLTLDYTYNADDDPNRYYYRSDHYNFAEKGIPSIFYFNGTHADYHRTTDTIEKINFDKLEKVARLVFYTSWELANRDERIKVDVEGRN